MWSGILLFSTDEILNWASENEFDAISMLFDEIYMYLVSAMYKNSMSDARVTLYICLKRRGLFVDELQRTCRTQALRLTVNIQFFKNRNGIQRNNNLLSSFCIFCWTCCLLSSVCPCNAKVNYKTVEVLILFCWFCYETVDQMEILTFESIDLFNRRLILYRLLHQLIPIVLVSHWVHCVVADKVNLFLILVSVPQFQIEVHNGRSDRRPYLIEVGIWKKASCGMAALVSGQSYPLYVCRDRSAEAWGFSPQPARCSFIPQMFLSKVYNKVMSISP